MLPRNIYPYLDLNDLNLDWLIKAIREIQKELTDFVSINTIKYANPIQWDITRQYEKNTLVIDPLTGIAYISVAPVPRGVALTRTEYWSVVFDLKRFIVKAAQNFTDNWEEETTTTATFSTPEGGWLVWGDVLYIALTNITAGDSYVVDSNIRHITVEEIYRELMQLITDNYTELIGEIGNLDNLTTTDKTNLVAAINELLTDIGTVNNNLVTGLETVNNRITDNLPFVNVIDYGAKGDGVTDDLTAFTDAITYCKSNDLQLFVPKKTYNLSEYIFTDDKYIFKNLGTYTNGKLVYSKTIEKGSFKKVSTKKLYTDTIFGDSSVELQCILWNEALNCFTFFGWDMSDGPNSIATIVNVDSSGNVLNRTTRTYGLINDATYFPVNNTILFSGSTSGLAEWAGKIIEMNATDFSIIGTYDSGVVTPYEISYDEDNEIIYVAGRSAVIGTWQMAILDTGLNIIKQYPVANVTIPPYTDSGNNFNYEGSCMINGQFFMQTFNNGHSILSTYNLDDGTVKDYMAEPKKDILVEECAYVYDGFLYVAGFQTNMLVLDKYDIKTATTNDDFVTDSVKTLASGSDLNDLELDTVYTYEGLYSNISHMPVGVKEQGAFIIKTSRLAGGHQYQLLYTQMGQIFFRNTTNNYKLWPAWKQIGGAGSLVVAPITFNTGFLSADGLNCIITIPLPFITRAYTIASITITNLTITYKGTDHTITDGTYTHTVLAKEDSSIVLRLNLGSAIVPDYKQDNCLVRMNAAIVMGDV